MTEEELKEQYPNGYWACFNCGCIWDNSKSVCECCGLTKDTSQKKSKIMSELEKYRKTEIQEPEPVKKAEQPDSTPISEPKGKSNAVNHPSHYNTGGIEVIDAIEAWNLDFCLGNTVKYIARAGHKDEAKTVEDLEKAKWYLNRAIQKQRKKEQHERETGKAGS